MGLAPIHKQPNNTMKNSTSVFSSVLIAALVFGAVPVFAQAEMKTAVPPVPTSAARGASGTAVANSARAKADQEITERIGSLNSLGTRVQAMVHLTADEKSAIAGTISSDISSLTALQTKIDADATSSLKADIQSITKGERIYMVVEPQILILAAADRAASIGDMFTAFVTKITARLATTPNATASSLLTDLQAKVADAQTQAAAAISETASLQPDNGVASVQTSNTAALKDARSKIKTALSDLKVAYQDAMKIVKALRVMPSTASTTPATSAAGR